MTRICVFMLSATSALLLFGCGQAFIVKKGGAHYDGIPFYVKEGKCMHTSIYGAPYYRLTLQQTVDSRKLPPMVLNVTETDFGRDPIQADIVHVLATPGELTTPQYLAVIEQWNAVAASAHNINPYTALCLGRPDCTNVLTETLVANSSTPVAFVNYHNVYTLNAKRPFSGTVQSDYKLAEDGTLSEVSAQIEDKTFETVLGALPIADLIKSGAGVATKFDGGRTAPAKLELSIERRMLKETRAKIENFAVGCPTDGAVVTDSYDAKVEDVAQSAGGDGKSDDAGNAISVTGTIKLPKPAETPKKASGDGGTPPAAAKKDDQSQSPNTSKKKDKKK